MTPNSESNLDDLIAEFVLAAEQGQAPDPADWLARHPGHAAELAAFLGDLGRFGTFLGLTRLPDVNLTIAYDDLPAPPGPAGGGPFSGYELLGEIGRGGMGTVYRARLAGTTLVVALKQIQARGQGRAATRQFRDEIESAAGLRHPNIVPVYHVGELAGQPFYTMALVEGGSLDRHVGRFPGDPTAAATLLAKTARAVHHAHQRRVLHRDLKPANILLDEAGEPHVADFGLAARMDESGTATGPAGGSVPWMAPEAVRGDATLTTAVDVWALGVILYELLTGERPFRGATASEVRAAILHREPPPPRAVNPRVPLDLDAICRRCLAKDPDGRYESATAVALELERWLRDEPVRARPAGRGERVARWCRRNPGLAVGAALVTALLVVGTAAALALVREQDEATRRVACEDNEHAASLAAGAFLHRLDQHGDFVLKAANDPALWRACRDNDMQAVRAVLRGKVEGAGAPGVAGIVSLYVLDPTGVLRAIWEDNPKVVGTNFAHRDYYRGAALRAGREGLERVHLSRVFTALNDGLDKLAVSVAFRPAAGGPAWVLAATIPTDPTFGLGTRNDSRHKVVLLAPREADPPAAPEYCVLVHPSYTERERAVPFPASKLRRDGSRFPPDDGYEDPVRVRHPDCEGRWLAGFASVEGTELVVLVQQKYDDAVAPQRLFFRRFLAWLGGLVAIGLLLVGSFRLVRGRTRLPPK